MHTTQRGFLLALALAALGACGGDDSDATGNTSAGGSGGAGGSGAGSAGASGAEQAGSAGASGESGAGGQAGAAGAGGSAGEGGASGGAGAAGSAGSAGAAQQVKWVEGPSLKQARLKHTATLLPDGRLLVVGGQSDAGQLASVEVLSADAASWSDGPALAAPRANHAAVLLQSGKVLIVGGGGDTDNGLPSGKGTLATALLFDPATNAFADAAPMAAPRSHFAAQRLADGKVLVAGGVTEGGSLSKTAEIYDPASNTWSTKDGPPSPTSAPQSAVLADGSVAITGGLGSGLSKSAALFDGTAWKALPSTDLPRFRHSMAVLPSGSLMVIAGIVGNGLFSDSIELLPSGAGAWKEGAAMGSLSEDLDSPGGTGTAALTLPSGRVLVTGSYGHSGLGFSTDRFCAVYDEKTDSWASLAKPVKSRGVHTMTRLNDGRIVLVGGLGGNSATASTEATNVAVD